MKEYSTASLADPRTPCPAYPIVIEMASRKSQVTVAPSWLYAFKQTERFRISYMPLTYYQLDLFP